MKIYVRQGHLILKRDSRHPLHAMHAVQVNIVKDLRPRDKVIVRQGIIALRMQLMQKTMTR